MAFNYGSSSVVYFKDGDLTDYLNEASSTTETEALETTTFRKTAKTYIPGEMDSTVSAAGFFDGDEGAIDEQLEAMLGTGGGVLTVGPHGDAAGAVAKMFNAQITSYEPDASTGDAAQISVDFQASGAIARGKFFKAKGAQAVTAAGSPVTTVFEYPSSAGLDNGALASPSTAGWTAHLHVFGVPVAAGSHLDVTIYHSTNGSAWSLLGSFAQVALVKGAQEITGAGNVNRYVVVRASITAPAGATASYTFAVAFARKRLVP